MAQGRVVRGVPMGFWTAGSNADGRYELMVEDVHYLRVVPLHVHETQEDSFFVLDGVLTVQIGDDVVELTPGDFAAVPPGVVHAFTNTDPQRNARMLNVMSPAVGFDRLVAAVTAGAPTDELVLLAKECGLRVVDPSLPRKLGLQSRRSTRARNYSERVPLRGPLATTRATAGAIGRVPARSLVRSIGSSRVVDRARPGVRRPTSRG